MYIFDHKIDSKKNLYFNLNKVLGIKNNYYVLLLKNFGINIYSNSNKNILIKKKNIYILRKILLNDNFLNLGIDILEERKINLEKKLIKFPLIKFKFFKGYPIRGQRTRTNGRTSKFLNKSMIQNF